MNTHLSASPTPAALRGKRRKQVLKQLAVLGETKLDGIRYLANDENPLDIQAELEGPEQTPYEGPAERLTCMQLIHPMEYHRLLSRK